MKFNKLLFLSLFLPMLLVGNNSQAMYTKENEIIVRAANNIKKYRFWSKVSAAVGIGCIAGTAYCGYRANDLFNQIELKEKQIIQEQHQNHDIESLQQELKKLKRKYAWFVVGSFFASLCTVGSGVEWLRCGAVAAANDKVLRVQKGKIFNNASQRQKGKAMDQIIKEATPLFTPEAEDLLEELGYIKI